ncbi:hypothetical protein WA171_005162 [Blastocystis sp. BT1]
MSFLICDNNVTKLNIPLINIPSGNGTFLLVKTGDTWEWKSYTGSTGGVGSIDISISEWKDPVDSDDITNRSFGIELVLSVTDKVKFINTDGITVYYDNNSIQLNGLVEQCFILIKEASSFRYTNNQYGSVSVRFISLQ